MKSYPSITTSIDFSKVHYLFDKLDGSNIRAEWSPKKGFYKFGSRTQLLVPEQAALYPSIEIIQNKFADEIGRRCTKAKFERAVCFFEYLGPSSFAGSHSDPGADMDAVLIDVDVYKKGLMGPRQFVEFTDGMHVPLMLYRGKISEDLFHEIRESRTAGITFEGVIGKSEEKGKNGHDMFKIKTYNWLNKLREYCNGDEELYSRLK